MEIIKELFKNQDMSYKKFHSKLCPNVNNIIGVRTPILKNIAKNLSKENYKDFLEKKDTIYYEEILLQGLLIGCINEDKEHVAFYLKTFIPKINNWAICDLTCSNLKVIKKEQEYFLTFIYPYLKSKKEFEVRFATIILLDYYLDEKYIENTLKLIVNVKHSGYYVKMGIAWLVSIAYLKNKTITMRYINLLDDWTYNKSIQKMIESKRISNIEKNKLKKLKRK